LSSLLKNLDVPISSQTLVFSKTSLQSERISPAAPRAMYFNDDVYVAWVQGGSTIEIMSVDPKRGAIFYALGQENDGRPQFEQVAGHVCSVCHYAEGTKKFVPRLSLSSVIPDETGNVEGSFPIPVDDQSPIEERWGGWYVTGTHGSQKYLSPHSDIVALMVLGHQVRVHNLIALASAKPEADPRETGEPLVKALLFAGAPPLKEPMKGTSTFAADFAHRGPRDERGRSLRDFDLNTRLFRYPLSYLIYSKPFDELPENVKAYVYRRLQDVLTGKDKSQDFLHLSDADRTAILEILRDTKPDFPR
jgi:hypothetical protein